MWRHEYNGDTFQHFKNCLFETPSRRINFNSPPGVDIAMGKLQPSPPFHSDCNVVSGKIVWRNHLFTAPLMPQIIFKFTIVF